MVRIALIVLDTLRKDRFDEFFDWIPGHHFDSAYSTANWTAPAHASLFTGRYPREVGVSAKFQRLDCDTSTISEELSDTGYNTVGYSANLNASAENNFNRGFDSFIGPSELFNPNSNILDFEEFVSQTSSTGIRLYLEAIRECIIGDYETIGSIKTGLGKVFERDSLRKSIPDDGASTVAQMIADQEWKNNSFVFVNLMEAHTPYNPPAPFNRVNQSVEVTIKNTFTGVESPETVRKAYDGACDYLSHIYKEIFSELCTEFDYIITLSDHGELLGEHGYWNHTYGLYQELTHIPLVITKVGQETRTRINEPVNILDVYQTIRAIADLPEKNRGRSLLDPDEINPVNLLAEYRGLINIARDRLYDTELSRSDVQTYDEPLDAVIQKNKQYWIFKDSELIWPEGDNPPEAFDTFKEISEEINAVEQTMNDDEIELSEEVKEHLEDLGYA